MSMPHLDNDFYDNQIYHSTEMVEVKEKFYYKDPGKFKVPVLTFATGIGYKSVSSSNIKNKEASRLGISGYSYVDFIWLKVPPYIAVLVMDEYGYIHKGTRLYVTFVGGDIDKPRIVGVY